MKIQKFNEASIPTSIDNLKKVDDLKYQLENVGRDIQFILDDLDDIMEDYNKILGDKNFNHRKEEEERISKTGLKNRAFEQNEDMLNHILMMLHNTLRKYSEYDY